MAIPQHMAALESANDIRIKRSYRMNWINDPPFREARERAALTLEDPPPELLGMRIDKFLGGLPQIGPGKVRKLTEGNMITPTRRIEELTERQRLALARQIRPGADPMPSPSGPWL